MQHEPGSSDTPHGIRIGREINLGTVAQILVIVIGGLWAVAQMNAQISSLRDQLVGFKSDMSANLAALRSDLSGNTSRLDSRIDTLRDSRSQATRQ